MDFDIDFIVWGGDLAYADGRADRVYRWYEWFDAIRKTLIDDDGRVIPIIAGIGNHELKNPEGSGFWHKIETYTSGNTWIAEHAPYYINLFAFPGKPGYDVLDFGNYLSLFLLDSDHANPVRGEQSEWLETHLSERYQDDVTHLFPVYHIPAYPSYYSYSHRTGPQL